jgi:hypothetical protein
MLSEPGVPGRMTLAGKNCAGALSRSSNSSRRRRFSSTSGACAASFEARESSLV